jgi:hypothetical protein
MSIGGAQIELHADCNSKIELSALFSCSDYSFSSGVNLCFVDTPRKVTYR